MTTYHYEIRYSSGRQVFAAAAGLLEDALHLWLSEELDYRYGSAAAEHDRSITPLATGLDLCGNSCLTAEINSPMHNNLLVVISATR